MAARKGAELLRHADGLQRRVGLLLPALREAGLVMRETLREAAGAFLVVLAGGLALAVVIGVLALLAVALETFAP